MQQMFDVYSSTHEDAKNAKPIETTFRNNTESFFWSSTDNDPNITFYFEEPILLTDYVIKTSPSHSYPKELVVYGSNNNYSWTEIDHQNDTQLCNSSFCSTSTEKRFKVNNNRNYHYIKMMNLKNSYYQNISYIIFSGIEFFGEIGMRPICTYHNQYFSNIRFFFSFVSIQLINTFK